MRGLAGWTEAPQPSARAAVVMAAAGVTCATFRPTGRTSIQSSELLQKRRTLLRTAATRTVPDLCATIRNAFSRFQPDECHNYIVDAGYDVYDLA